jgi:hypothetical protein
MLVCICSLEEKKKNACHEEERKGRDIEEGIQTPKTPFL